MTTGAGPLAGRVALVTGAARGIGLATAQALHAAGAEVWLVARSEQALALAAGRLGARAHAAPCDLTDEAQCEQLLSLVESSSGRLDLLVHSAGSIALGTVQDVPPQTLRQQLESNLVSAYALTRAALGAMLRDQGDVVFVGSSVGRAAGTAGKAPYAASHHGLRAFAEALREEVNPKGLRVTFLHVGQTATQRQEALYAEAGREYRPERLLQPADVAAVVLGVVLLPRTAEVTELSVRPRQKP
jgi:NAD(P)-dependent dehydrogenase (short-subunit alcohol dehydrogenase family)